MATNEFKNKLNRKLERNYLSRDFASFKAELLRYAKTYFPDKIQDFSEASVGGLLLDMAAYVGDSMSFYLDYQFNELDYTRAIESSNIKMHAENAGVKITGASPASTNIQFYIEVPSKQSSEDGSYAPDPSALPIIKNGTTMVAANQVNFTLTEDLDFSSKDETGSFIAKVVISETNDDGTPAKYVMNMTGTAVSGKEITEKFSIPNSFVPFRTITLSNRDVSEIISITDSSNNEYYEVENLSQDVVYIGITNLDKDANLVRENLELQPAPYRFTSSTDINSRISTIQFGSGKAVTLDDDLIPDPSELSLPLFGKKTFARFTIDPNNLLAVKTLGISPVNTDISVRYRYGGGLNHNVPVDSIRGVNTLSIDFPGLPTSTVANDVRASVEVTNPIAASGGDQQPTIEDIRALIPSARNAQSRVVSREDLLARIYTLPNRFGRVFRAGIGINVENPLSKILYIVSKDQNGNLRVSPDALKKNLSLYLNSLRLISDAIDILDVSIVNYKIEFSILTMPTANREIVLQKCIDAISDVTNLNNMQIDQPIVISDIQNAIINTNGVMSLVDLKFTTLTGDIEDRSYSDISVNMEASTVKGLIVGPEGSLFELKFPDFDIIGSAE